MIFFELKRWGDFDIAYTEGFWYKETGQITDEEMTYFRNGVLLTRMLVEFRKLTGEEFGVADSTMANCSLYCGKNEGKVINSFEGYLRSRGYRPCGNINTITVQFTNEVDM